MRSGGEFVRGATAALVLVFLLGATPAPASYVNFESGHVHPIDLTPSGNIVVAVNTPDALLELFAVQLDGSLTHQATIPVGLEPVSVRVLDENTAWVVNHLSDTVSIVDLALGLTVGTLEVGDEPTDVVFAGSRAFVAVTNEDAVKVYDKTSPGAPLAILPLASREIRALAVSPAALGPQIVYAVGLKSGNKTTVVNGAIAHFNLEVTDAARLTAMNLRDQTCDPGPPSYPPLPPGFVRNPALIDPTDGVPKVGLIVQWNDANNRWEDETGTDWNDCLPYTIGDHDLFAIDATSLAVTTFDSLGTSLFEVSVHPTSGRVYVANTDARNAVRFEHPAGLQGHIVENRFSVLDPGNGNALTTIDLNSHINRASDPATNLAERNASISQPGMMVWKPDGSVGYLTAIGSRKLFRVNGACMADSCIFGANRATPDAVEVGDGPTGVVLQTTRDRLYVLNRISHSIAIVQASTLTRLDEIALHDPSSQATLVGRRFLYDAIDSSAHGDAACSSCHLSGDMDGLAWDLGDPTGGFRPYSTQMDNVRFVTLGGIPCSPGQFNCAAHQGFDPQKGPMTTQTLRGMLEPLHWRGDRPTFNDFNKAFIGLMGKENIGTEQEPAGLSAADMEKFRQFSLELAFPPNPYRNVDDSLPDANVQVHGSLFAGNPTTGEQMFNLSATDGGQPCVACHTHPFGAGGGKLGGVTPTEPTSGDASALFNGTLDLSLHSDLKIPHLRNMYEKFGPVWPDPGDGSMPETIAGFGFTHDGSTPDLFRFLSAQVFNLSAANQAKEVRDLVSFMEHFPTGIKPSVGRQLTLAPGAPPRGTTDPEMLLATLIAVGDLGDPDRHCELTVTTIQGGRQRSYHLDGGSWVTDVTGEPAITTATLRTGAEEPLTFTCGTLGSGTRLGGNRDDDIVLNGDDCAPADPNTWTQPLAVADFALTGKTTTQLTWNDQSGVSGPSLRYDVLGGELLALGSSGHAATGCVEPDLIASSFDDTRPAPALGDGYYYLVRARNPCGASDPGPGNGRELLGSLICP